MRRRPGGKGQQKRENDEEKEYCRSLVAEKGEMRVVRRRRKRKRSRTKEELEEQDDEDQRS